MPVADTDVDERALVHILKVLRELIEEEHALELDRAARIPPLAFDSATSTAGDPSRTYVFRAGGEPAPSRAGEVALKVGDSVEVVPSVGRGSVTFGTVASVNPASVVVEFSRPISAGVIPTEGTLRVRVDDNQRTIRLRAIERVVRERHTLKWIGPVLTGAVVAPLSESGWDPPVDLGVTDGQRRALVGATRCEDLFLIQGPPGTGKTTVIATLLRYFVVERGARVLLSSKGHRAIDNALDRLGSTDLHVLRLGQSEKVSGAGRELRLADVLAQAEQDVPQRHLAARTDLEETLRSLVATEQLRSQLSVASPEDTRSSLSAVRRARENAESMLAALRAWGNLIDQPGALADMLVQTVDVVAATAVGVNSGRDGARTADLEFDVAIVDEAGQAQLTDLVVPLSRSGAVILVGDHQQLPPSVDDDLLRRCRDKQIDTTWLARSVFEFLWDRVPPTHRTRLDVQFRMPHVIADFLGRVFYAGELTSAAAKQGSAPVSSLFQSAVVFVDTSAERDRGETALSPGFSNQCEARLVADVAARLPSQYRAGEGLGVIAPYGAQVAAIRQALAKTFGLAVRDPWLLDNVATVDSFQGQERDVILVSLTRSNAEGSVGFLSDLNRLNVTLSRAREQLVVIGDLSTLCASGGSQERRAFARFADELAGHVHEHGEFVDVAELRRRLSID